MSPMTTAAPNAVTNTESEPGWQLRVFFHRPEYPMTCSSSKGFTESSPAPCGASLYSPNTAAKTTIHAEHAPVTCLPRTVWGPGTTDGQQRARKTQRPKPPSTPLCNQAPTGGLVHGAGRGNSTRSSRWCPCTAIASLTAGACAAGVPPRQKVLHCQGNGQVNGQVLNSLPPIRPCHLLANPLFSSERVGVQRGWHAGG